MQSSGVTGSAGAGPNVSPAGFASPKLRVPGSCLAQGMRSRESALGVWHREVIKDNDRVSRWFHQIFPVRYRPRVSASGCFFCISYLCIILHRALARVWLQRVPGQLYLTSFVLRLALALPWPWPCSVWLCIPCSELLAQNAAVHHRKLSVLARCLFVI